MEIPIKINNLNSPLLNKNIDTSNIIPVVIPNIISSIFVIISDVLKLFLNILKISKISSLSQEKQISI